MKCHHISTAMIYWQTIVIDYKLLIWSRIRTDNIEYKSININKANEQ
jgi:hypothetical protein